VGAGQTQGMTDLATFARLSLADHGLVVISTTRADGSIQSSLVNAGVLDHPRTGEPIVGTVLAGRHKVRNLRARPRATLTTHSGWEWTTVEGTVELVGPDDPLEGVDAERLRVLLREIFIAAGGEHDDWDGYDKAMADEGRVATLITPTRVYSNG